MRFILFIITACVFLFQKADANIRYQGGMLIHTGFLMIEHTNNHQNGLCYGFGGQLNFLISDHIRLGSEGYSSYFHYPEDNGIFRLGWGGILLGYQLNKKNLCPVLNLTIGGASVNDMQFIEVNTRDEEPDKIIYRRHSGMVISPAIVMEYKLKSKYTAIMKIDYLIPLTGSKTVLFATGPRLYMGFLFGR